MRNGEKPVDPFDFVWDVPAGGFRWVTTTEVGQPSAPPQPSSGASEEERLFYELDVERAKPGRWLTTGVPVGSPLPVRRYSPLYGAAFKEFATLPLDETKMLQFACYWGPLLGGLAPLIILPSSQGEAKRLLAHGENLDWWIDHVRRMRDAVMLWERLRRNDEAGLRRHIRWERSGTKATVVCLGTRDRGCEGRRYVIAGSEKQLWPEMFASYTPGEIVKPAWDCLQRLVNDQLEAHTASRVLWNRRRTTLRLHVVPASLLGCMWLQLARVVDGDWDYRACEGCPRWFVLTGARRPDARYCNRACKQRVYREHASRRKGAAPPVGKAGRSRLPKRR